MFENILNWMEKYRVVIGTVLTVALIAVGGWLAWLDWHPPGSVKTTITKTTVPAPASDTSQAAAGATLAKSSAININTATLAELDNLTGIGPAKAQSIVDYRATHGSFKTTHDLVNVKGIGEATYAKLKDQITIGGE